MIGTSDLLPLKIRVVVHPAVAVAAEVVEAVDHRYR